MMRVKFIVLPEFFLDSQPFSFGFNQTHPQPFPYFQGKGGKLYSKNVIHPFSYPLEKLLGDEFRNNTKPEK